MIKGLMMLGALGYMATMAHGHPATATMKAGAGDPRPTTAEAAPSPSTPSPGAAILDAGRSIATFLTTDKQAGGPLVQASAPAPTACNLVWSTGQNWSDYYTDEQQASAKEPAASAALPSSLQS